MEKKKLSDSSIDLLITLWARSKGDILSVKKTQKDEGEHD